MFELCLADYGDAGVGAGEQAQIGVMTVKARLGQSAFNPSGVLSLMDQCPIHNDSHRLG